jgi:hypothetical protein
MGEVVNRRKFVAMAAAVTGGSVALTACSDAADSLADVPESFGGGDNWGELPDKKGKNHLPQMGNDKVEFKPKFLCLVYLKFGEARLIAKHAFFPFRADDRAFAKKTLSEFATQGWPADAKEPSDDFNNFVFGSQQRIYFFVDNGVNVVFDEKFLIAFTPFGTKTGRPRWDNSKNPPVLSSPKTMDENHAFFDATIVEPNFLSLDNWFTKKSKKPISNGDPDENYSMNIHLKMSTSAGGFIPIIIDPDTGNGAGNEP